jgi:hypothetical protein
MEAGRVVGGREDHPGHAGPAGGLEHAVRAVRVEPEHLLGLRLAGLPTHVHDRVDPGGRGDHRVEVVDRGEQHLFVAGALDRGRLAHVEQP